MKTTLFRSCLFICCVFLAITASIADTIKLKNGSVIKGKVTTFNDREFTIMLDLGSATKRTSSRMVIAVDDVESIQFDSGDVASAATLPSTESGERFIAKDSTTPAAKENSALGQPTAQPTFTNAPAPGKTTSTSEPVITEKSVLVAAAADWTSTEIKVKKGQRISITATGQVDLGSNRMSSPNGIQLSDPKRLILTSPTGSLIAVIGDDNDEFIHVGNQTDFVAERDGVLFLSINEGNLKDNNGSFSAKVRVSGK